MLFVEYFVEAVLVEGLPSMQLESVLILGVWGLLNLFPDFMQFLQGPVLLSVQDDVHSASAHQLLQDTLQKSPLRVVFCCWCCGFTHLAGRILIERLGAVCGRKGSQQLLEVVDDQVGTTVLCPILSHKLSTEFSLLLLHSRKMAHELLQLLETGHPNSLQKFTLPAILPIQIQVDHGHTHISAFLSGQRAEEVAGSLILFRQVDDDLLIIFGELLEIFSFGGLVVEGEVVFGVDFGEQLFADFKSMIVGAGAVEVAAVAEKHFFDVDGVVIVIFGGESDVPVFEGGDQEGDEDDGAYDEEYFVFFMLGEFFVFGDEEVGCACDDYQRDHADEDQRYRHLIINQIKSVLDQQYYHLPQIQCVA